jgi:hypothetical protein
VSSGADNSGQFAIGIVGVLAGNSTSGANTAEEQDDGNENETNDDKLTCSGVAGAVVGPGTLASTHVLLDLVGSELVVNEAAKGNAVAEELERRDWVAEDHHGGDDEENVLEHTAESHDETRGSADLSGDVSRVRIGELTTEKDLPRTRQKRSRRMRPERSAEKRGIRPSRRRPRSCWAPR